MFATPVLIILSYFTTFAFTTPVEHLTQNINTNAKLTSGVSSCFPALDFHKPLVLPQDNTHWWCDPSTEYAFVGFSYEVTACEVFYLFSAPRFLCSQ